MAQARRSQQTEKASSAEAAARTTAHQMRASTLVAPLSPADLLSVPSATFLQLQRTSGNGAVQQLVQRAQAEKTQRASGVGLSGRPATPEKPHARTADAEDREAADAVAVRASGGSAVTPALAEQFGKGVGHRMGSRALVQRKGGKLTGAHSAGVQLKKGDVIDYDEKGDGFRTTITIKSLNGQPYSEPVVIKSTDAINLKKVLEDYDGPFVGGDGPSRKQATLSDEARLENVRERTAVTGNKNPDLEEGIENSFFSKPRAVEVNKATGDITVEMVLRTYNRWDRVKWLCRVGSKQHYVLIPEDKKWWSNPAWERSDMHGDYSFREGADLSKLAPEGVGRGGTSRAIRTVVPGTYVKQIFGADLSRLSKSSIICFGMEVYYGGSGPTTATKTEFANAYDANVATAHQYGLNATSTPESYGYVDLSGADLPEGQWLTDEEVWNQDIEDNPSPNIKLPIPKDYAHAELIEALQPKEGMQIATRIENEATLKVSSLERLADIISYLGHLSKHSDDATALMRGDPTLEQFEWSVNPDKNSDVFSDIYLDDLQHTALRAGVGIRKRWTPKATKLNVKTGPGYQVGELGAGNQESPTVKSDIYRRHEIGYDLHPDAQISDIRAFLAAGVETYDPWNRGGEQANEALPEGKKIDLKHLQGTMVLKGDRRKFNLKAVHKRTGGAVNIEISCDHTVARTFTDYEKVKDPPDLFDVHGHYEQVFNVEMELEHLGAGPKAEAQSTEESETGRLKRATPSDAGSQSEEPSAESKAPDKQPRPGHPGRLYMRGDTANPKFNTQSFEVFSKAHTRMIRALQLQLKDSTELAEDKQKLENLFARLFPHEDQMYGRPIERRNRR